MDCFFFYQGKCTLGTHFQRLFIPDFPTKVLKTKLYYALIIREKKKIFVNVHNHPAAMSLSAGSMPSCGITADPLNFLEVGHDRLDPAAPAPSNEAPLSSWKEHCCVTMVGGSDTCGW
jgi:hypothetical protein